MRHSSLFRSVALSLGIAGAALAQPDTHAAGHAHAKAPTLGTIVFPNSGNAVAQAPLLRGVALLHSFEYEDAAAAFREAQKADPSFALAYWMEALTFSHVVWRVESLDSSRAVLQRLGPTPAERLLKAKGSRDRAFGAAVEAFYVDAPLQHRVRAYADSMRSVVRAWPDDQETAAFAAHALMVDGFLKGAGPGRDSTFREAIGLAQRVFKVNRNHPGATHYLIHMYDSPEMAAQGLGFARIYDKDAPDAEHALHMPSHIYLQLGMWADVVASNERAWAASRASNSPDWHAFSWLQYGYLQQGRWAAARGLIDSARTILARGTTYLDATFVIPRLEFQYAAATQLWNQPLTPPAPPSGPMQDRERAFRQFANYWLAVDAALRNDPSFTQLAAPYLAIADSVRAGGARSPVQSAPALLIDALAARARGDRPAYLRSLQAAADLERKFGPFVGPPERVFALEMLGEELIAEKRADEAARAYEDVLRLAPGRSEALLGLARARVAAGNRAGANDALALLRKNWEHADVDVRAILARFAR